MKKIIGASVALLALTSCGAPTVENPADALQKNQSALIENVEKLQKLTPTQAKSVGTMALEVEAKEGKANADFAYDFQANQETYETAGNLTMKMNLEASDPIMAAMNMSGDMSLDIITLKDKVLFKLNSLNIDGADENPQLAMVTAMTAPFQNNWYFLNNIAENPIMSIQQELLTKQKEVVSLMKKHTILEHVATNENADFYDYDVKLNEDNVVNFMKDIESLGQTEENTDSLLTQEEIDDMKLSIANFNTEVKANIKIDKSNLEYFTLSFTHIDGWVTIENSKKSFNVVMNDTQEKWRVSILWTKSKTQFDAMITVEQESEDKIIELINGSMSIKTNGENSEMTLAMTVKDEYTDEELKINFTLNDTTTAEDVTIEEPSDAKNFEEVIGQMMWGMMGAPIQMESDYNEDDYMDIEMTEWNIHMSSDDMELNMENGNMEITTPDMDVKMIDGNIEMNTEDSNISING